MKHILLLMALAGPALADPVEINEIRTTAAGESWRFDVTVTHPDTGWDHYADGWRIEDADGTVLGLRVLAHPHVNEQPFTRSLSNVMIPQGTIEVFVRARCSVDGWNEDTTPVQLTN